MMMRLPASITSMKILTLRFPDFFSFSKQKSIENEIFYRVKVIPHLKGSIHSVNELGVSEHSLT